MPGKLSEKAVEIANELEAEGYSPEDKVLYAELDKRLKPWRKRMLQDGKQPVAPVNRGAGRTRNARNQLSEDALVSMDTFGYDRKNPKHREMFLRANEPLE